MKTLEEVIYDAGRHALAEQESYVSGIRQRTGTLLAAHALVASFLGSTTIRQVHGLRGWGWVALAALVLALVLAAVLLSSWRKLTFAVDAPELYHQLYEQASAEAAADTLGWLVSAGYGYQELQVRNVRRVLWMARLSSLLGILMVVQTLAWLVALAVK